MKYAILMSMAYLLGITAAIGQNHQLIKKWETDSIFKVPESVLYDKNSKTLFVSNIDGKDPWGADNLGSVGKMDADGKNIIVDWVTGLQAPKGMSLFKGNLYVADLKEIVVINITTAKIINRIPISGAVGLNDISISKNGAVYVSDSKTKSVYIVKKGKASIFLDSLKGPNGVLAHNKKLYMLDYGTLYKVNNDNTLVEIASGMEGGTDGVEIINKEDFIVSTWSGVVYYVNADGSKQILMDGRSIKMNSADIGFDAKNNIVFVPSFWRNTVAAYEVK